MQTPNYWANLQRLPQDVVIGAGEPYVAAGSLSTAISLNACGPDGRSQGPEGRAGGGGARAAAAAFIDGFACLNETLGPPSAARPAPRA